MPDSLILYPALVFTHVDNMKVILSGHTINKSPHKYGIYKGRVEQGSANSGEVTLNLSKLSDDFLQIDYIGDPSLRNVNIGIGSLLMYAAVLSARLNCIKYILIHSPVKSALGWYFKFGFYPDPISAHNHDGDSNNQRAMHDCDLFGNVNLIPSKQAKDISFEIRYACSRCPTLLKGNIDLIEVTSREYMHKKGWNLSVGPTSCSK